MKCFICGNGKIVEFLDLGKQPLANKYPATKEDFDKEDFFPLSVLFCPECKNVQLGTVVSRERMFEDYYYLSSVNPGLVRHFEKMAKELSQSKFVVDIGSNDGILLKPLKELGVKAIGVDPSVNVGKIANDAGLKTIISFFGAPTAEKIRKEYGVPDVIVASSIFTHLDNPHEFVRAVDILMDDDSNFIIEVEYIGNILKDVQFERFYLDRIFYYSLTSLKNLFARYNMHIADVEEIEPHGGSIRVVVNKDRSGVIVSERVKKMLKDEEENLTVPQFNEFAKKVQSHIGLFKAKLVEYKKSGIKVAGYGAPARVATICNFGGIGPEDIDFLIDDSVLKQNKFSPGTHIPIFPAYHLEKSKPDVLVVFAYEYLDDIIKKTKNAYKYLIPIPPREVN